MVLNTSIPSGALVGAQPFTLNLPAPQFFERLATGTVALDTLSTDYTPLWDDLGAVSTLYLRTALAVGSTLSEDVGLSQNYIDVVDGSAFAKDDYIVVDDGNSNEEYLKIQWVDGDRLWFGSAYQSNYKPSTVVSHDSGETVDIVTLTTLTLGVDYSLNTAGSFTELLEKGNGAIFVAKYTSDFVMPAIYPATLNETPDVTEAWGKWAGKSIADGTYRLGIWTDYGLTYTEQSENNSYPVTSPASVTDILVGSATTIEPYALIGEIESCYACHDDIYFHGGHRRGVDACIQCHGNAGAEDRPQYVAPGADPTTATLVRFREMIHKIHNGSELEHADTYIVNGFGSAAAYPNNFTAHNYAEVTFPAMPGGTKHCMKCHGTSDAWESPAHVVHPTESLMPQRSWREACGSCHDGDAVHAHIDAQTSPSGAESCTICHDDGSEIDVENVHKPRM